MANRASRSFSGVFRLISFVLCCEFSAFASEVTVSSLSELSAAIADASAFEATTILISPMVSSFTLSAQITLDKPITIRSAVACDVPREDMPLFTASGCRAFYLNHPEARLVGLAIKGGVATSASPSQHYGGNVLIGSLGGTLENCILDGGLGSGTGGKGLGGNLAMLGASGVVSNCVLRNGRDTTNYGGKGAGAYINAGLITHCVITNNYSWRSNADGGLGVSVLGSGVVRYSLIAHNYETGSYQPGLKGDGLGAAYVDGNGVLENCTIVDNTSGGRCAGVWCNSANGTVRNCIIAGNRTSSKSLGAEILGGKTAAVNVLLK